MKNSNFTIKILHIKGAWTQNPSTRMQTKTAINKRHNAALVSYRFVCSYLF